ncbi:hypothetical protein OC845_002113 [Tilletia horrida]|nr:hypothetical protein OC845_002113 [Tilletia horrida]
MAAREPAGHDAVVVPPLKPDALVETLLLASEPSPSALHRADSILTTWERTEPTFCPLLLALAFDTSSSASLPTRIGAIIRLKNVCDKFWRPRVVSRVQFSIPDDVKAHVRQTLLERTLAEPDRTIALQATVAISKVARTDFPMQWPNLFEYLQTRMIQAHHALQTSAPGADEQQHRLTLLRAAETTARSLKVLASAKLLAGKLRMTELSKLLLPTLHPIFSDLFQSNLPIMPAGSASIDLDTLGAWASTPFLIERIRTTHLLLKCLTHLAVADMGIITARTSTTTTTVSRIQTGDTATHSGSNSTAAQTTTDTNLAQAFFRSMPMFLQQIFDLRSALVSALLSPQTRASNARTTLRPLLATLTKHLTAFSKLFLALIERDKSKAARWDGWAEVILWYWARAAEYEPQPGRAQGNGTSTAGNSSEMDDIAEEEEDPDADAGTLASADPGSATLRPARFTIHALVLLRLTLSELKRPGTVVPSSASALLSEAFLSSVLDTVLSRHILLTRAALREWMADPESWVIVEGKGAQEVSTPADASAGDEVEVRHAAERLLLGIVLANKAAAERVWQLFAEEASSVEGSGPPTSAQAFNLTAVLRRDAIYNALGYVTPYLPEPDARVSVAVRRLLPEASLLPSGTASSWSSIAVRAAIPSDAPSTWLLIRRRILILLDSWSERLGSEELAASFPVILSLMQPGQPQRTDLAVRLTAAGTLWQLVDTPEFKPEMFSPHVEDALRLLCGLIVSADGDEGELQDLSSIRTCTRTLALITERMGPSVAPHVPTLAALIPALWERDDDQCKIRPGVLVFLGRLLSALALVIPAEESTTATTTTRSQLEELHRLAAHLIEQSLQPSIAPLLGIDALHLWSRALSSTPYMTPPLYNLLRLAPALISSPDYTQHVCNVFSSSALLAPFEVVIGDGTSPGPGEAIWKEVAGILADETSEGVTFALKVVDEVVQTMGMAQNGSTAGAHANAWAEIVVRSGLAHALLGATLHFKESAVIGTAFISAIARIAVTTQRGIFLQILRDSASRLAASFGSQSSAEAFTTAAKRLVRLFCERFENMASRHRRRLVALGLAKMVEDADPSANAEDLCFYEALPEMVTLWMEVLEDEKERQGAGGQEGGLRPSSPLDTIGEDIDDVEWLEDDVAGTTSPEAARWTNLRAMDPARSGAFAAVLARVLNQAQTQFGGWFGEAMARVDPLVLEILTRDLQVLQK